MANPIRLGADDLELGSGALSLSREFVRLMAGTRVEPGRLKAGQQARLHEMVALARRNVPMYRALWQDLPVDSPPPLIDKPAIRAFSLEERMSGPVPAGSRSRRTSGSSGAPLEVMYPPGFARWQGLLLGRTDLSRDVLPWQRKIRIAGTIDRRASKGLISLLRRRELVLPLDLPLEELAREVSSFHPRMIRGHPHMLLQVGELLAADRLPRRIGTAGETLDPIMREALHRCYGNPPLDTYGTAEVGVVGWQCAESDVYHVNHESVLVEILDDQGRPAPEGELGEVVLSGLGNPLMPFIRYRIGDLARWSERPCRCGYGLPGLSSIEGRTLDWFTAGDGTRVAPQYLWLTMRSEPADLEAIMPSIARYQVVQLSSGSVTVSLELLSQVPQELLDRIERSYAAFLKVPVEVRLVDRLEHDQTTKFRLIRSELA